MLSKLSQPKFPVLASLAAVTLVGLLAGSDPASAASITYSRWLNIGPQMVGDGDNGKFTLKITGNIGNSTQTDPQYNPQLDGKVLFQFSAVSLPDNLRISEVYFNDNGGLFAKKTNGDYDAWFSAADSVAINTIKKGVSQNDGLQFIYDNSATLPQGSSINVTSSTNLSKPSFAFDLANGAGNVGAIQTGETLGILVKLNTGKTFVDILNSLTQDDDYLSDLLVAAHIIGYDGALSDGFYYGNAYSTTSGTQSALTAGPNGTPLYYDSYGAESDPNPATKPSPSPSPTTPTNLPGSAVPEPLTILGAATAAGLGASFKRRLRKAA